MKMASDIRTSFHNVRAIALAVPLVLLFVLSFCVCGADAASTHPFAEEWSVGSQCEPREVATDAAGNVYVVCQAVGVNGLQGSIRKFSPTGEPISFTANVPYVSGNSIVADPGDSAKNLEGHPYAMGMFDTIDVDKSSARPGFIYITSNGQNAHSGNVDIFAPSGEYVTSLTSPGAGAE